ncbi:MAG: anti-sigma factor [Gemmatimonadales bacterium]
MKCSECRELIDMYVDDELMPEELDAVRNHIASCEGCAAELQLAQGLSNQIRTNLARFNAPDVLKARIRSALVQPGAMDKVVGSRVAWWRAAAGGVTIAAISSVLTVAALNGRPESSVENEVMTSHVRSLMPGHLTDVASTNQHNVKPWFNGRVDLSPLVVGLDSAGFVLIGGRLDYVNFRPVPVVVYGRRQHGINVFSWPIPSQSVTTPHADRDHGYTLVNWQANGVESWVVSDLNRAELDQFVAHFRE